MPKTSLYYFIEEQLKAYSIVMDKETIEDDVLGFNISNGVLYVDSILGADIEDIEMDLFGLYNTVEIENIRLSSVTASFIPSHIRHVKISYSLFNPVNIVMDAEGEFGDLSATFNVREALFHLNLRPSQAMLKGYKNTLKNLEKSEDGGYVYAKNI